MKKIIDVSYLERPELREYLHAGKNNFVVFCDYACMESYKGDAIKNIFNSLKIVSDYPTQVLILKGTREVVVQTLEYETNEALIDLDQTHGFNIFCDYVRRAMEENSEVLENQILEHGKNATSQFNKLYSDSTKIAEGFIGYEKSFKSEYLKIIRTGKEFNQEMSIKMIQDILLLTTFLFQNHPDIKELPPVYKVKNSYIFRYALSAYILLLDWLTKGSIKNVPLNKLTSDAIDLHYVAYATYFDGLLSLDNKMKRIYDHTIVVLEHAFSTTVEQ